jgi:allantoin racemase
METALNGETMKIKLINPDYGMTQEELDAREKMLGHVCGPDVFLHMECLTKTKVVIDSMRDVALASPEILQMAMGAERDGFDAVVLYCFNDPGIAACRDQLAIPVIGSGQAAVLLAAMLGYRMSVVTMSESRLSEKRVFIQSCGIDSGRIASVRGMEKTFSPLEGGSDEVYGYLEKAALACVKEDGADVVALGCLSLAGKGERLSKIIGVPVVDPAFTGVTTAVQAVRLGLLHSKAAYPYPPVMYAC